MFFCIEVFYNISFQEKTNESSQKKNLSNLPKSTNDYFSCFRLKCVI